MIAKGTVVLVKNWGVHGERFYVYTFWTNTTSPWPEQVGAYLIENMPTGKYPRGKLGSFHAFPLDNCVEDKKATKRFKEARG